MKEKTAQPETKLRKIRKEKGYTLAGLADEVGVHFTHISKIENGESEPSVKVLKAIARTLECSIDDLLED